MSGPQPAVRDIEAIERAFRGMWDCAVVCEAVPLTIFRPPGGSALEGHIDSGSMLEMYVACRGLLRDRGGCGRLLIVNTSNGTGTSTNYLLPTTYYLRLRITYYAQPTTYY